jgi:hypothetical protein
MNLDFPTSPTVGQLYPPTPTAGLPTYKWDGEKWAAISATTVLPTSSFNYIINGGMWIDQSQLSPVTATAVIADQWGPGSSLSSVFTASRVASPTPGGSPNRLRLTVTTARPSLAAGDYCHLFTRIEGLRVINLGLGTAAAKQMTCQFGVRAPAGTYTVVFRNGSVLTRSYPAEFTIAAAEANVDVVKSVTVPPETTGTWPTDTSAAIDLMFSVMCGTTYAGPAGAWGSTNYVGSSTQSNLFATNGNVFELFDVGLYAGAVAPPFQLRPFDEELAACKRYYCKSYQYTEKPGIAAYGGALVALADASGLYLPGFRFTVEMRAAPTVTLYRPQNGATGVWEDASGQPTPALTSNWIGSSGIGYILCSAGIVANHFYTGHYVANARL